jgi:class 3 adenylate cyclase
VLVTDVVADSLADHPDIDLEGIGEVPLKGFPEPTPLYLVKVRA